MHSCYGTCMARVQRQKAGKKSTRLFLVSIGLKQGDACPNASHHPQRKIVTSAHGDDFTSSGPADSLDWMERVIGENYEVDIQPRIGPGPNDAKEARVLNRVIRWCEDRIEYEADPRQIERLVAECGLGGGRSACQRQE